MRENLFLCTHAKPLLHIVNGEGDKGNVPGSTTIDFAVDLIIEARKYPKL